MSSSYTPLKSTLFCILAPIRGTSYTDDPIIPNIFGFPLPNLPLELAHDPSNQVDRNAIRVHYNPITFECERHPRLAQGDRFRHADEPTVAPDQREVFSNMRFMQNHTISHLGYIPKTISSLVNTVLQILSADDLERHLVATTTSSKESIGGLDTYPQLDRREETLMKNTSEPSPLRMRDLYQSPDDDELLPTDSDIAGDDEDGDNRIMPPDLDFDEDDNDDNLFDSPPPSESQYSPGGDNDEDEADQQGTDNTQFDFKYNVNFAIDPDKELVMEVDESTSCSTSSNRLARLGKYLSLNASMGTFTTAMWRYHLHRTGSGNTPLGQNHTQYSEKPSQLASIENGITSHHLYSSSIDAILHHLSLSPPPPPGSPNHPTAALVVNPPSQGNPTTQASMSTHFPFSPTTQQPQPQQCQKCSLFYHKYAVSKSDGDGPASSKRSTSKNKTNNDYKKSDGVLHDYVSSYRRSVEMTSKMFISAAPDQIKPKIDTICDNGTLVNASMTTSGDWKPNVDILTDRYTHFRGEIGTTTGDTEPILPTFSSISCQSYVNFNPTTPYFPYITYHSLSAIVFNEKNHYISQPFLSQEKSTGRRQQQQWQYFKKNNASEPSHLSSQTPTPSTTSLGSPRASIPFHHMAGNSQQIPPQLIIAHAHRNATLQGDTTCQQISPRTHMDTGNDPFPCVACPCEWLQDLASPQSLQLYGSSTHDTLYTSLSCDISFSIPLLFYIRLVLSCMGTFTSYLASSDALRVIFDEYFTSIAPGIQTIFHHTSNLNQEHQEHDDVIDILKWNDLHLTAIIRCCFHVLRHAFPDASIPAIVQHHTSIPRVYDNDDVMLNLLHQYLILSDNVESEQKMIEIFNVIWHILNTIRGHLPFILYVQRYLMTTLRDSIFEDHHHTNMVENSEIMATPPEYMLISALFPHTLACCASVNHALRHITGVCPIESAHLVPSSEDIKKNDVENHLDLQKWLANHFSQRTPPLFRIQSSPGEPDESRSSLQDQQRRLFHRTIMHHSMLVLGSLMLLNTDGGKIEEKNNPQHRLLFLQQCQPLLQLYKIALLPFHTLHRQSSRDHTRVQQLCFYSQPSIPTLTSSFTTATSKAATDRRLIEVDQQILDDPDSLDSLLLNKFHITRSAWQAMVYGLLQESHQTTTSRSEGGRQLPNNGTMSFTHDKRVVSGQNGVDGDAHDVNRICTNQALLSSMFPNEYSTIAGVQAQNKRTHPISTSAAEDVKTCHKMVIARGNHPHVSQALHTSKQFIDVLSERPLMASTWVFLQQQTTLLYYLPILVSIQSQPTHQETRELSLRHSVSVHSMLSHIKATPSLVTTTQLLSFPLVYLLHLVNISMGLSRIHVHTITLPYSRNMPPSSRGDDNNKSPEYQTRSDTSCGRHVTVLRPHKYYYNNLDRSLMSSTSANAHSESTHTSNHDHSRTARGRNTTLPIPLFCDRCIMHCVRILKRTNSTINAISTAITSYQHMTTLLTPPCQQDGSIHDAAGQTKDHMLDLKTTGRASSNYQQDASNKTPDISPFVFHAQWDNTSIYSQSHNMVSGQEQNPHTKSLTLKPSPTHISSLNTTASASDTPIHYVYSILLLLLPMYCRYASMNPPPWGAPDHKTLPRGLQQAQASSTHQADSSDSHQVYLNHEQFAQLFSLVNLPLPILGAVSQFLYSSFEHFRLPWQHHLSPQRQISLSMRNTASSRLTAYNLRNDVNMFHRLWHCQAEWLFQAYLSTVEYRLHNTAASVMSHSEHAAKKTSYHHHHQHQHEYRVFGVHCNELSKAYLQRQNYHKHWVSKITTRVLDGISQTKMQQIYTNHPHNSYHSFGCDQVPLRLDTACLVPMIHRNSSYKNYGDTNNKHDTNTVGVLEILANGDEAFPFIGELSALNMPATTTVVIDVQLSNLLYDKYLKSLQPSTNHAKDCIRGSPPKPHNHPYPYYPPLCERCHASTILHDYEHTSLRDKQVEHTYNHKTPIYITSFPSVSHNYMVQPTETSSKSNSITGGTSSAATTITQGRQVLSIVTNTTKSASSSSHSSKLQEAIASGKQSTLNLQPMVKGKQHSSNSNETVNPATARKHVHGNDTITSLSSLAASQQPIHHHDGCKLPRCTGEHCAWQLSPALVSLWLLALTSIRDFYTTALPKAKTSSQASNDVTFPNLLAPHQTPSWLPVPPLSSDDGMHAFPSHNDTTDTAAEEDHTDSILDEDVSTPHHESKPVVSTITLTYGSCYGVMSILYALAYMADISQQYLHGRGTQTMIDSLCNQGGDLDHDNQYSRSHDTISTHALTAVNTSTLTRTMTLYLKLKAVILLKRVSQLPSSILSLHQICSKGYIESLRQQTSGNASSGQYHHARGPQQSQQLSQQRTQNVTSSLLVRTTPFPFTLATTCNCLASSFDMLIQLLYLNLPLKWVAPPDHTLPSMRDMPQLTAIHTIILPVNPECICFPLSEHPQDYLSTTLALSVLLRCEMDSLSPVYQDQHIKSIETQFSYTIIHDKIKVWSTLLTLLASICKQITPTNPVILTVRLSVSWVLCCVALLTLVEYVAWKQCAIGSSDHQMPHSQKTELDGHMKPGNMEPVYSYSPRDGPSTVMTGLFRQYLNHFFTILIDADHSKLSHSHSSMSSSSPLRLTGESNSNTNMESGSSLDTQHIIRCTCACGHHHGCSNAKSSNTLVDHQVNGDASPALGLHQPTKPTRGRSRQTSRSEKANPQPRRLTKQVSRVLKPKKDSNSETNLNTRKPSKRMDSHTITTRRITRSMRFMSSSSESETDSETDSGSEVYSEHDTDEDSHQNHIPSVAAIYSDDDSFEYESEYEDIISMNPENGNNLDDHGSSPMYCLECYTCPNLSLHCASSMHSNQTKNEDTTPSAHHHASFSPYKLSVYLMLITIFHPTLHPTHETRLSLLTSCHQQCMQLLTMGSLPCLGRCQSKASLHQLAIQNMCSTDIKSYYDHWLQHRSLSTFAPSWVDVILLNPCLQSSTVLQSNTVRYLQTPFPASQDPTHPSITPISYFYQTFMISLLNPYELMLFRKATGNTINPHMHIDASSSIYEPQHSMMYPGILLHSNRFLKHPCYCSYPFWLGTDLYPVLLSQTLVLVGDIEGSKHHHPDGPTVGQKSAYLVDDQSVFRKRDDYLPETAARPPQFSSSFSSFGALLAGRNIQAQGITYSHVFTWRNRLPSLYRKELHMLFTHAHSQSVGMAIAPKHTSSYYNGNPIGHSMDTHHNDESMVSIDSTRLYRILDHMMMWFHLLLGQLSFTPLRSLGLTATCGTDMLPFTNDGIHPTFPVSSAQENTHRATIHLRGDPSDMTTAFLASIAEQTHAYAGTNYDTLFPFTLLTEYMPSVESNAVNSMGDADMSPSQIAFSSQLGGCTPALPVPQVQSIYHRSSTLMRTSSFQQQPEPGGDSTLPQEQEYKIDIHTHLLDPPPATGKLAQLYSSHGYHIRKASIYSPDEARKLVETTSRRRMRSLKSTPHDTTDPNLGNTRMHHGAFFGDLLFNAGADSDTASLKRLGVEDMAAYEFQSTGLVARHTHNRWVVSLMNDIIPQLRSFVTFLLENGVFTTSSGSQAEPSWHQCLLLLQQTMTAGTSNERSSFTLILSALLYSQTIRSLGRNGLTSWLECISAEINAEDQQKHAYDTFGNLRPQSYRGIVQSLPSLLSFVLFFSRIPLTTLLTFYTSIKTHMRMSGLADLTVQSGSAVHGYKMHTSVALKIMPIPTVTNTAMHSVVQTTYPHETSPPATSLNASSVDVQADDSLARETLPVLHVIEAESLSAMITTTSADPQEPPIGRSLSLTIPKRSSQALTIPTKITSSLGINPAVDTDMDTQQNTDVIYPTDVFGGVSQSFTQQVREFTRPSAVLHPFQQGKSRDHRTSQSSIGITIHKSSEMSQLHGEISLPSEPSNRPPSTLVQSISLSQQISPVHRIESNTNNPLNRSFVQNTRISMLLRRLLNVGPNPPGIQISSDFFDLHRYIPIDINELMLFPRVCEVNKTKTYFPHVSPTTNNETMGKKGDMNTTTELHHQATIAGISSDNSYPNGIVKHPLDDDDDDDDDAIIKVPSNDPPSMHENASSEPPSETISSQPKGILRLFAQAKANKTPMLGLSTPSASLPTEIKRRLRHNNASQSSSQLPIAVISLDTTSDEEMSHDALPSPGNTKHDEDNASVQNPDIFGKDEHKDASNVYGNSSQRMASPLDDKTLQLDDLDTHTVDVIKIENNTHPKPSRDASPLSNTVIESNVFSNNYKDENTNMHDNTNIHDVIDLLSSSGSELDDETKSDFTVQEPTPEIKLNANREETTLDSHKSTVVPSAGCTNDAYSTPYRMHPRKSRIQNQVTPHTTTPASMNPPEIQIIQLFNSPFKQSPNQVMCKSECGETNTMEDRICHATSGSKSQYDSLSFLHQDLYALRSPHGRPSVLPTPLCLLSSHQTQNMQQPTKRGVKNRRVNADLASSYCIYCKHLQTKQQLVTLWTKSIKQWTTEQKKTPFVLLENAYKNNIHDPHAFTELEQSASGVDKLYSNDIHIHVHHHSNCSNSPGKKNPSKTKNDKYHVSDDSGDDNGSDNDRSEDDSTSDSSDYNSQAQDESTTAQMSITSTSPPHLILSAFTNPLSVAVLSNSFEFHQDFFHEMTSEVTDTEWNQSGASTREQSFPQTRPSLSRQPTYLLIYLDVILRAWRSILSPSVTLSSAETTKNNGRISVNSRRKAKSHEISRHPSQCHEFYSVYPQLTGTKGFKLDSVLSLYPSSMKQNTNADIGVSQTSVVLPYVTSPTLLRSAAQQQQVGLRGSPINEPKEIQCPNLSLADSLLRTVRIVYFIQCFQQLLSTLVDEAQLQPPCPPAITENSPHNDNDRQSSDDDITARAHNLCPRCMNHAITEHVQFYTRCQPLPSSDLTPCSTTLYRTHLEQWAMFNISQQLIPHPVSNTAPPRLHLIEVKGLNDTLATHQILWLSMMAPFTSSAVVHVLPFKRPPKSKTSSGKNSNSDHQETGTGPSKGKRPYHHRFKRKK